MKVKKLQIGDTIGFICPSSKMDFDSKRVEKLEEIINGLGYKIKYGKSCSTSYGYLGGTDLERTQDINEMFQDPEVDAIICMLGGYGASRIVDKIDYDIIRNNPKLFVGFSDITVLLNAFNQKANLQTIHGQMGIFLTKDNIDDISLADFKNLLTKDLSNRVIKDNNIKVITGGIAEGEIVGGNLTLIVNLIGSEFDIDFKNKIVFIEEVNEKPRTVDRMFAQLRLSGKLKQARAFIFGHFTNCNPEDNNQTVDELIDEYFKGLNVPVITNFPSGHDFPFYNIPIGINSRLNTEEKELKILGEIYEKN